jgi:FkbM family methyltransferase
MTSSPRSPVRLTETRYGRLNYLEFDDPIGHSLEVYGEWAQTEIDFLARFIDEGDCVVDIGANIGTHTLAFASLVGAKGRVVAIEPQPEVFALLKASVELNGCSQVELHASAVSDAQGTAQLHIPDYMHRHNSGTASLASGAAGRTVVVDCLRIDDLGLDRCAVIKMDIEGWEDRALDGGRELLMRSRPVVYAECNSIDAGWHLIAAAGTSFAAFLHAPLAFNERNHRRNPDNIFGAAQETNLVLVPTERLPEFERELDNVPHLDRVKTLDDLSRAFLRAARYGDKPYSPERSVAIAQRLLEVEKEFYELRARMPMTDSPVAAPVAALAVRTPAQLTRPVHVIVPIYNGFDDFERLVESLFHTHPTPNPLMTFVFIDDGSPDPRIASFLMRDPVFERSDVVRLHNAKNRGFIGTVNRGLEAYCLNESGTDVIILNTDTLVFGNVLAILQDVAYRLPNVATVTPWSNNATIASLLNWPHGGELFTVTQPEDVAQLVEAAAVQTPLVDAPTGVGFCMYMTRQAAQTVGGFDPAFGLGYGEENNWCQHAAKRGFVNLICTEAFVYHHGSVSFGDETKRALLAKNLRLLEDTHPNYHRDVHNYVQGDPLRVARQQVQWAFRRHYRESMALHTVLYMLHSDPSYYGGGTEKHVMALTEHLLANGRTEVMHLYADAARGQFVLRSYFPRAATDTQDSQLVVARYNEEQLYELLHAIAPEIDTLHVHHFLEWPRWLTRALPLFAHARRLLTLHDYFSICPSIRLLGRHGYCQVPSSLSACNACLKDVQHYRDSRIEEWRSTNVHFLEAFDTVLTPSEAARKVLVRGFGTVKSAAEGTLATRAATAITVQPNFILDLPEVLPPIRLGPATAPPRVVFLGAYSEPKGARLVELTAHLMQRRGWDLEIWGTLGQALPPGVTHRTYTTPAELRELGQRFPVEVVVLPATWPETFSFTTFEAALDLRAPVVVGPYGNPPEIVSRFGIGVVLRELTPESFLEAIESCLSSRAALVGRLELFEHHARSLTVENYLRRVYAHLGEPRSARPPLRELPAPASVRGERMSQGTDELAVRYELIDQTNIYFKTRLPGAHAFSKSVGNWLLKKVRASS